MSGLTIGMVTFPNITQLDLTGPLEFLSAVPGWSIDLVAATLEPVASARGYVIQPTQTFENAPSYDLLVVPGGPGVDHAMLDDELVAFIRRQGVSSRYIFGICTGSLLLGAAGLLDGKTAGCHWQAADFLTSFGATPSRARMTVDGNVYTSGGVTAGIDMALKVIADVAGQEAAQAVQLLMEYDPEPPFRFGTPETAPLEVQQKLRDQSARQYAKRAEAVEKAALVFRREQADQQ